ncbi:MAG TPA: hypothetical protein VK621_07970, partial [Bradyrhizobium sp.]|nr:hypothetical protein [Bradyrhizobium sp.]
TGRDSFFRSAENKLQMMRFKGESWELFGPLMSGEKNSRAGVSCTRVIASRKAADQSRLRHSGMVR